MSLTTIPLVISSPSLTHTATASLQHRFFRAVDEAGMEWDAAAPDDNLFLQRSYLRVLEECPPEGMRFGYLVFYLENRPVGVAVCQIKYFKGDDNIAELDTPVRETCFFKGLAQWFKKWVAGKTAAD
ncbi:MAG: hypothetical protein IT269_03490, partial [Saprospiraceae bacterium]|nr:hypothetical protein [Saprospiraceae bacterium]